MLKEKKKEVNIKYWILKERVWITYTRTKKYLQMNNHERDKIILLCNILIIKQI